MNKQIAENMAKYPVTFLYLAFAWKILEASDVFIARLQLPEYTFFGVSTLLFLGLAMILILTFAKKKKNKILIVDDHAMVRAGVKNLLLSISTNHTVHEASNGFDAIKMVMKNNYDLIFTDINMPIMNGLELSQQLKTNKCKSKIVAYTMLNDTQTVNKMVEAGASGFLLKSSSIQEIQAAIETILHGGTYFSRGLEPR